MLGFWGGAQTSVGQIRSDEGLNKVVVCFNYCGRNLANLVKKELPKEPASIPQCKKARCFIECYNWAVPISEPKLIAFIITNAFFEKYILLVIVVAVFV